MLHESLVELQPQQLGILCPNSLCTRFLAPVYPGDTVTAIAEVSEKLAGKQWVRLKLTWLNQRQDLVAESEALVMPPR